MTDQEREDLANRLNDAWAELRTLPLGGRGHLADVCLEAAAAIRSEKPRPAAHDDSYRARMARGF